jgi:hypothetical protein
MNWALRKADVLGAGVIEGETLNQSLLDSPANSIRVFAKIEARHEIPKAGPGPVIAIAR